LSPGARFAVENTGVQRTFAGGNGWVDVGSVFDDLGEKTALTVKSLDAIEF